MKLFLTLFLLAGVANQPANETHSARLDLIPIAATADDEIDRQRYLTNPVNSHCNLVNADSVPLVELAGKLEESDMRVANSKVLVQFPIGDPMSFVGTVYEGVDQHGRNGPFLWEGQVEGGEYFASIVIEKGGRVKAYLSASSGMFRLLPARGSDRYFLCQRNSSFTQQNE